MPHENSPQPETSGAGQSLLRRAGAARPEKSIEAAFTNSQSGAQRSHGIYETLWRSCHKCRNRAHARTSSPMQARNRCAGHAAKRCYVHCTRSGQSSPPDCAERCGSRVACGGKGGRQKHQPNPCAGGTMQLGSIMRGAGQSTRTPHAGWQAATAQMHGTPQGSGQPPISRNHQHQPPVPAQLRKAPPCAEAVLEPFRPKHHTRQATGQPRHGRERIWRPHGVREEPQRRQPGATPA